MSRSQSQTQEISRDRPAHEPGGCECQECGCIFIGEEWHQYCAVCVKDVAAKLAEAQRG